MSFPSLPLEMRTMIFDHLVSDREALATACLVSYGWHAAAQYSHAWLLWAAAHLTWIEGKGLTYVCPVMAMLGATFLSDRRKTQLFRTFVFRLYASDDRKTPYNVHARAGISPSPSGCIRHSDSMTTTHE